MSITKPSPLHTFCVLGETFRLSGDFQKRPILEDKIVLYFFDSIVHPDIVQQHVIQPIQKYLETSASESPSREQIKNIVSTLTCKETAAFDEITKGLLDASTFVYFEEADEGLLVSTPKWAERGVEEVYGERTFKGPRWGFSERHQTNINIIRSLVKTPELVIESKEYGSMSNTNVSILYIQNCVSPSVLKEVKKRISSVNVAFVLESRLMEEALEGKSKTIADLTMISERVDTTVSSLYEGRIVVLVEGYPVSIIVPVRLVDFFQSADDYHMKSGRLINRLMRMAAVFVSVFLPGVYIAFEKYYSDDYSKEIREGLFNKDELLPTFWELMILLFLFRILFDVGTRAPKTTTTLIGLIATIVIGQASVSAKLIHPAGLVLTGVTFFLSFTIVYRGQIGLLFTLRYLFLFVGYFFNFTGIVVSAAISILYLSSLKSIGVPFLLPFIPFHPAELVHVFFRPKLEKQNKSVNTSTRPRD